MVWIFSQAAICASTPTDPWYSLKASSNSGDEYCEEFQMPFVASAALRYTSGVGPVAVVHDAQLGGAGAGRVGRLLRAPLGAVEGVQTLHLDLQVEPGLLGPDLDDLGQLRDLLQVARVEHRA